MGAEAASGTAICIGGNEWHSKHSCKHWPFVDFDVDYSAL